MFALSIKKGHEDGGALVMFVNVVVTQIKPSPRTGHSEQLAVFNSVYLRKRHR